MTERPRESVVELISPARLASRVAELGEAINTAYGDQPLTVIVVATGAFIFAADLVRHLRMPVRLDLIGVSSYSGTTSRGQVTLHLPPRVELADQPVLLLDDIYDTGVTWHGVLAELRQRGARDIRGCVLLGRRRGDDVGVDSGVGVSTVYPAAPVDAVAGPPAGVGQTGEVPEWVGFLLGDEFVVGYGLDFNHSYRNLPYLGELLPCATT